MQCINSDWLRGMFALDYVRRGYCKWQNNILFCGMECGMNCRNSIIIQKLCNMYRMTQSNWYVDRQSIVTIIKFAYGYQLSV